MTTTPYRSLTPGLRVTHAGSDSILEHVEWLRGLASRLARDEAGADDLLQRTAVVALRRQDELHGANRRGVRGWLAQVLHNEARNEWRSQRRRRDHEERAAEGASATLDPAEGEERLELTRSVLRAVDGLDEPYRSTILARYFDDLSVAKIAERQGVPKRTVNTRLHRGREKLRGYLHEHAPRGAAWATLVLPGWEMKAAHAAAARSVAKSMAPKLWLAAASVAAVTAVATTWGWAGDGAIEPAATLTAGSAHGTEALVALESAEEERTEVEAAPVAAAVLAPTAAAASQGAPQATVRGRVVSELGEPLEDAAVRIYSFDPWEEEGGAQELVKNDVPLMYYPLTPYGFTALTDAEGRFVLELPLHPANAVSCVVDAGLHRERWSSHYADRQGAQPQLVEGERDLGTITLGPAGAVAGRVVDALGEPVAMARVSLGERVGGTLSLDQYTDEDGQFVLGHAPEGELALGARAEGYVMVASDGHRVDLGQTLDVGVVVLESAPTISGLVRDPSGVPVEGVEVGGWPRIDGPGRHARAMTDAGGRFTIALPQVARYTLTAKKSGFVTWGDESGDATTIDPGTAGLEITLVPVSPMVVRVVDDGTGEPVEAFGFYLLPSSGQGGDRPIMLPKEDPPIRPRPDGVIEVPGRDHVDAYALYIEGKPPFSGTLIRDAEEAPHMVIRIESRPSIRGRFVRDGQPIPGASVLAIPGKRLPAYFSAPVPGETAEERAVRHALLEERSLRRFEPEQLQEVRGVTDEEGYFEITGLKRVPHALRLTEPGAEATLVYPVDVTEGAVDLGPVEAMVRGSIGGRLLLPAGVDAAGLRVELMCLGRRQHATADAAGRFEFSDLDPRLHEVLCQGRPGEVARSLPALVEVAEGWTTHLQLVLTDRLMTPVRLRLQLRGEPVTGATVFATAEIPDPAGMSFTPALGTTDEEGVVEGAVSGAGELRISLSLDGAPVPGDAIPAVAYQSGVPVDEVVELQLTELALTLPAGVSFPDEGELQLVVHPDPAEDPPEDPAGEAQGALLWIVRTELSGGQPSGYGASAVSVEGQTVTYRHFPHVKRRLSLDVTDSSAGDRTLRPLPGLSTQNGRWPSVYEAVFEVDCETGTCAPIQLTQ